MPEKHKIDDQHDVRAEDQNTIDLPRRYRVILHNDDYTPMDFVVNILMNIFKRDAETATKIMLNIHNKGKATCGVYTYEIAETKITQTHQEALENGYPLRASMEEE